jgi:transcriptional regulator with XRE-family HTH domain
VDETELIIKGRKMMENGQAKRLRIKAGLTLREAGDACHISHCTIYSWENRLTRPRPALLAAYTRLLLRLEKVEQEAMPGE